MGDAKERLERVLREERGDGRRRRVPREKIPVSVSPRAVDTRVAEDMVGGPLILNRLREEFGLVPLTGRTGKSSGKQVWSVRLIDEALRRLESQLQRTH